MRYKFTFKYGQIDVEIDKGKEVKQTSRKVVYNLAAEVLGKYTRQLHSSFGEHTRVFSAYGLPGKDKITLLDIELYYF